MKGVGEMRVIDKKSVIISEDYFLNLLESFHASKGDELIALLIRTAWSKAIEVYNNDIELTIKNISRVYGDNITKSSVKRSTAGEIVLKSLEKESKATLPEMKLMRIKPITEGMIEFAFEGEEKVYGEKEEK